MKRFFFPFICFSIIAFPCFSKTILLNKVILPKQHDTYMEVRHIVLKGTNFEIGEALGQIAQTWLNIYPSRYEKSLFVTARNAYMQNNYPILFQRMKGVAKAYNQSYNHTLLDFSALPYDVGSFACSIMYFPITTVKNDHPLIVRNGDSLLSYRGGGGR